MRHIGLIFLVSGAVATGAGCNQSSKQSGNSGGGGTGQSTSTDTTATTTGSTTAVSQPSANASVDNITATSYPDGFYTGYDGGAHAFALLLPGFRTYTVEDTSIAKIEQVTVTVPQATLDSLNAALKKLLNAPAGGPDGKRFPAQQTMYRLTPLKAGTTTISTTNGGRPGGGGQGGGGPGGAGGDVWGKGGSQALVVTSYTSAQVAAGQQRYENQLDASNPACASCHLTGKNGAPPHALGDINSLPDVAAAQWVSTGKVGGRTAKIAHAWKFSSDDQEISTIAYVRTLEASNPEQMIILQFAQRFGLKVNSDGSLSVDESAATATSTGTTTN